MFAATVVLGSTACNQVTHLSKILFEVYKKHKSLLLLLFKNSREGANLPTPDHHSPIATDQWSMNYFVFNLRIIIPIIVYKNSAQSMRHDDTSTNKNIIVFARYLPCATRKHCDESIAPAASATTVQPRLVKKKLACIHRIGFFNNNTFLAQ